VRASALQSLKWQKHKANVRGGSHWLWVEEVEMPRFQPPGAAHLFHWTSRLHILAVHSFLALIFTTSFAICISSLTPPTKTNQSLPPSFPLPILVSFLTKCHLNLWGPANNLQEFVNKSAHLSPLLRPLGFHQPWRLKKPLNSVPSSNPGINLEIYASQ
jgi:hypothetical protein